jgi:predicted dehydrogenase
MDLGVHLIDALMWLLDGARVERVESALFARGTPLAAGQVEDYASVRLHLAGGAVVELACSWKLPVGRDAQIELELFARDGALRMRNVAGSFYDFVAERTRGTSCERLVDPPDAWGGRAIVAWAKQLAQSAQFDPSAQRFVDVAGVIDQIYGRVAELPRARQNATCEFDALRDSVTDARAHSAIGST